MGSSTIIKNAGIGVIALIVIGGAYVFLTDRKKEESPLLARNSPVSNTLTQNVLLGENAPELWENIGENVVSKVVRPFSRSRISSVISEYSLDEIKNNRSQVEAIIRDDLNKHFSDRGLNCEGFLLSEVRVKTAAGGEKTVISADKPMGEQSAEQTSVEVSQE